MAMPARDIREWLESFEEGDLIAIDEGALALVGLRLSGASTAPYIEVGGGTLPQQLTFCEFSYDRNC